MQINLGGGGGCDAIFIQYVNHSIQRSEMVSVCAILALQMPSCVPTVLRDTARLLSLALFGEGELREGEGNVLKSPGWSLTKRTNSILSLLDAPGCTWAKMHLVCVCMHVCWYVEWHGRAHVSGGEQRCDAECRDSRLHHFGSDQWLAKSLRILSARDRMPPRLSTCGFTQHPRK